MRIDRPITSSKPQTTRHVIRGIVHRENAQLVLVDTPGLHRPRTLLGERLNDLVREVWSEVRDSTIEILDRTTFADLAKQAGGRWRDESSELVP